MHGPITALIAALILVGCTTVATPSPSPTATPSGNAFVGVWLDAAGRPVPDEDVEGEGFVAQSGPGGDHCGWESVTFLFMSWPPGRVDADWNLEDLDDGTARMYVRDPEGVLAVETGFGAVTLAGSFDADADLPASAVATGLHREGREIWTTPDDGDSLYLVGADRVERWQRAVRFLPCI